VEGRDNRHPQVAQQGEDVAAGRPAVQPELVLEADRRHAVRVQEVGDAPVRGDLLLRDLVPDLRAVGVPGFRVGDRDLDELGGPVARLEGVAQVARERGDAAAARQAAPDEGDAAGTGGAMARRDASFSASRGRIDRIGAVTDAPATL
jgi:hypothetical protein